jgi:hypothetical protein
MAAFDVALLYSSPFLFGLLSKATVEFDVGLFFFLGLLPGYQLDMNLTLSP